ncbi:amino acid-binding ACT domain protein [Methanococcus maripaludis C5]|uniref:Amino acid-binding ACT domain protein n=2 Tax=Methanococcus maripaludis TaxID=39152 RepID=A4G0L8_METM5|nr:amino acid-binding ACT domain protein [Methanococcus maripaludis C5]
MIMNSIYVAEMLTGEKMIFLDLELKDSPGELLKALQPISSAGANIFSVIHMRENKTQDGRVPVKVVIEKLNDNLLNSIIENLEKLDVIVAKINEKMKKTNLEVVVVGHIVDTDVLDTIDRINEIGVVVDLDLTMPDPIAESSARMRITIDNEKLNELYDEFEKIAKEKSLLFIKSC